MTFEIANPFGKGSTGPTVRMSIRKMKAGGASVKFSLNTSFVDAYLEGASAGDVFRVQYGTGDDKGKVMLVKHHKGNVPLRAFSKHSFTLTASAWRGITNASLKPTECAVLLARDGSVVLQMPEIAK